MKPARVIYGKPLNPPIGLERAYVMELTRLVRIMCRTAKRELESHFAAHPLTQDASPLAMANALVARLSKQFAGLFDEHADRIAEIAVTKADKESKLRLAPSLKKLSGGIVLKSTAVTPAVTAIVTAQLKKNVSLIKSIPEQYLAKVHAKVQESVTTGKGLKTLLPYIQDQEGITLRRARMIAEDQTRKAYNHINKARMGDAGIAHFQWMHSGGSVHPRELHMDMFPAGLNNGIYSFDDLPEIDEDGTQGIPGDAQNCHCRMRPVVVNAKRED